MEILQVVLVIMVIVNCSESCKPYYKCKIIHECPRMVQLLRNRNTGDLEFVRKSNCGYVGKDPMVCCPKLPCWTPDRTEGHCMSIHDCPAVKTLSQAYALTTFTKMSKTVNYILNSRSRCPDVENGVCCPFPLSNTQLQLKPKNQTQDCRANELPPDPQSNCCGVDPKVGHRISRGAPTLSHQYTWLAILKYNVKTASCAGSLISGLYVLTAAHCVFNLKPVCVLLGEYDKNYPERDCKKNNDEGGNSMESQIIYVKKIISHTKFMIKRGAPYPNDIALLQLSDMAKFNEFVRPICLPSVTSVADRFGQDLKLISAGWGITDFQDFTSHIKMSVDMPFEETKDCAKKMRMELGAEHMCTGNTHGEGPCDGDSGGPLMHETEGRFEAVGIVSLGTSGCEVKNISHIFTNVTHYLGWIHDNIKNT